MGSKISQAKELKNGKMSLKLEKEMLGILWHAVESCIIFDEEDLPEYFYFLLDEIRFKMRVCHVHSKGKLTLKKSEYFALFTYEVTKYLDEPTKILLREMATPVKRIG